MFRVSAQLFSLTAVLLPLLVTKAENNKIVKPEKNNRQRSLRPIALRVLCDSVLNRNFCGTRTLELKRGADELSQCSVHKNSEPDFWKQFCPVPNHRRDEFDVAVAKHCLTLGYVNMDEGHV